MGDTATAITTLPLVRAVRYVQALREGGSLPGLIETDDLGTYVVKFRGAGQGTAALVAEIVVGELGRRLGIRVPDLILVDLDEAIGRREPDPDIQQLLLASVGVNLGMDFLPRAVGYDGRGRRPPPVDAAAILWLDALTVNVDRSWRNPNLLLWHGDVWAIDHGASLIFHHGWPSVTAFAGRDYPTGEHVLAPFADHVAEVHERLAPLVTREALAEVMGAVPEEWLPEAPETDGPEAVRSRYADYLLSRLEQAPRWLPGRAA
ncbi:aminotransferase class I and II [Phytoactinopolyspora alkaliphila]|uniref:Aminotransferase class I and II n=1 Tax=Phytoactinopolyspora alkaliphila TaxID=1783498 RepID=A0A6N9YL45_9ACTN|nr:HipA family kinase [Phytoactinopolyspora alkaliphila]NED95637.1 aminotransferase class I and II [Phytoactinopolyspora alkaliphila]